jgi:EmrB/QacA subfamily drug resistance transporter
MDAQQGGPTGRGLLKGRSRRLAVFVVLIAFFMDILDGTIVNVAIPSIQGSIGADFASIQWIVAGYALTFALFLIPGGRLGDIYGYKTMFLIGMAGFTIASAICGFSTTASGLVVARLLQGAAAAIMVPQIMSTIQILYVDPKERQHISAFYGGIAGLASVLGPILGALLVAGSLFGLGWRMIFLVNVPVGIFAIVAAWYALPSAKSPHPLKLDLLGTGLALLAMTMLIFPLIQGRELEWPRWTFAMIAAALPVFGLFAWSQKRRDRIDGSPLVVPSLFHYRSFVVGILICGSFFGVVGGFFLTQSLYMQLGRGFSVMEAGLTGIPFSLGVSVAAGLSGPILVPRFGRAVLTTGAFTLAAAMVALAWTAGHFGKDITPWEMIPSLIVGGIGMGLIVAPVFNFVLVDVPVRHAGSASGIVSAMGQVGTAMGIALTGVVFFGRLAITGEDYISAFQWAIGFEVAALIGIGILTLFLPRYAKPQEGGAIH